MKVLIAVDQSECSQMAVQSVVKRHWPTNSEFRIISVCEPIATQCVGYSAAYFPTVLVEAEQSLRKQSKEYIKETVAEVQKNFVDHKVSGEVLDGYAWRSIVDDANHWGADLIIVGSHGRSGLSRIFLGSVAEAVAGHASCSVEIIKGHPLVDEIGRAHV